MATFGHKQSSNPSKGCMSRKRGLLGLLLLFLSLVLTLIPIYYVRRPKAVDTSPFPLSRSIRNRHSTSHESPPTFAVDPSLDLEIQGNGISQEYSELQKMKATVLYNELVVEHYREANIKASQEFAESKNELSIMKAAIKHCQQAINQLTTDVEFYKEAYIKTSREFAQYKTNTNQQIADLVAGLNAQKSLTEKLQSPPLTNEIDSTAIKELIAQNQTRRAQETSEDLLKLKAQSEQSIEDLKKELETQKKSVQELAKLGKRQTEILEDLSLQNALKTQTKKVKDIITEERKTRGAPTPLTPFDSSDETVDQEIQRLEAKSVLKWFKKASEKMQEGLQKGREKVGKAVDKVKTVADKASKKFEGVGSMIGTKVSSQMNSLLEKGKKANELLSKLIETARRSNDESSDFDLDFEL